MLRAARRHECVYCRCVVAWEMRSMEDGCVCVCVCAEDLISDPISSVNMYYKNKII